MLGARIALLRKNQKMSQQKLAQMLQVSPSAVGMYEQGRRAPDYATLRRMAELFGVSTDYLLGGVEDAQSAPTVQAMIAQIETCLDGQLFLKDREGAIRSFGKEELALLLASLL